MGAGSSLSWSRFEEMFDKELDQQMPFIAGCCLLGMAVIYGVVGICPCIGGCCDSSDSKQRRKSKASDEKEFENPSHDEV